MFLKCFRGLSWGFQRGLNALQVALGDFGENSEDFRRFIKSTWEFQKGFVILKLIHSPVKAYGVHL